MPKLGGSVRRYRGADYKFKPCPSTRLERLGQVFLREIGLAQPHVIADDMYGSVAIHMRDRILTAPWPTSTRDALYVLAHEVGHWQLHTEWERSGHWVWHDVETYVMEHEADTYAHRKLRAYGVAVPKHWSDSHKQNVRRHIRQYLRTHIDLPDLRLMQWAGTDVAAERNLEWAIRSWEMLDRVPIGPPVNADVIIGAVDRWCEPDEVVDVFLLTPRGHRWAKRSLTSAADVYSQVSPSRHSLPVSELAITIRHLQAIRHKVYRLEAGDAQD